MLYCYIRDVDKETSGLAKGRKETGITSRRVSRREQLVRVRLDADKLL